MTDDLEMLLRDHYRRAAEDVHPGPGLIHRAQAAAPVPRRRRPWPLVVSLATAGVVLAVPLVMSLMPGHDKTARRVTPQARNSQQVPPIVLHLDRAEAPAGAMIRLTGEATARLDVLLRIRGGWRSVAEITPVGGRYAGKVVVPEGATAVRVCTSTPVQCSATLTLIIRATSHTPTTSPRHIPRPPTSSPRSVASRPPVAGTPTSTPFPSQTPLPGH